MFSDPVNLIALIDSSLTSREYIWQQTFTQFNTLHIKQCDQNAHTSLVKDASTLRQRVFLFVGQMTIKMTFTENLSLTSDPFMNFRREQSSSEIRFSVKAHRLKASFIPRRLPGEEPGYLAVDNGVGARGPIHHQRGGRGGGEDRVHRAAVGLDGHPLLRQPLKHPLHILQKDIMSWFVTFKLHIMKGTWRASQVSK